MKNTTIIIALIAVLIFPCLVYGQDIRDVVPKGKSVYVLADDRLTQSDAESALKSNGCWRIVADSTQADFFVEFITIRERMDRYKGYIRVLDPKTNKVLFKSETIDTIGRWTYHARRGIVRKMVNKIVGR